MTTHESAAAMRTVYELQLASSKSVALESDPPTGHQAGSGSSKPEETASGEAAPNPQHPTHTASKTAKGAGRSQKRARVMESDEDIDDMDDDDEGDVSGGE